MTNELLQRIEALEKQVQELSRTMIVDTANTETVTLTEADIQSLSDPTKLLAGMESGSPFAAAAPLKDGVTSFMYPWLNTKPGVNYSRIFTFAPGWGVIGGCATQWDDKNNRPKTGKGEPIVQLVSVERGVDVVRITARHNHSGNLDIAMGYIAVHGRVFSAVKTSNVNHTHP